MPYLVPTVQQFDKTKAETLLIACDSEHEGKYGATGDWNGCMDVQYTNIYGEGSMSAIVRRSSPNTWSHLPGRLPREYLRWSEARVREIGLSIFLNTEYL